MSAATRPGVRRGDQDAARGLHGWGQVLQLTAADYNELARERHEPGLRDIVVLFDGTRAVSRFRNAQLLWLGADGERTVSAPTLPWPKLTAGSAGLELAPSKPLAPSRFAS